MGQYRRIVHITQGTENPIKLMLIWDTEASYTLTPFRSDLIDYVKYDIPVKYLNKTNRVIGIGTTLHKSIN